MVDPLVRRLTSRSEEVFEAAAREALALGEEGERALIEAMEATAGSWRKFELAAELGRASGDLSLQALRALLTDPRPNTKDAKSVALTYLALRLGAGATTDLVQALGTRSTENLNITLLALCATGTRPDGPIQNSGCVATSDENADESSIHPRSASLLPTWH